MENSGAYVIVFHAGHFCLAVCSFVLTALPCSGGYHLERSVIQLHDAVRINCEKGASTENHCADVKFMG